jgi:mono/diheme cytochrome c family protein
VDAIKKQIFWASAVVIILLLAGAVAEFLTPEWRGYQREYSDFLSKVDPGSDFGIEYSQLVLPHIDKIDRCVICHVSLADSRTEELGNPVSPHPGDYLERHDPNIFGCTICHDGQGRATDFEHAVGHFVKFWEEPVLKSPYLEANCARCHRSDMPVISGAYQRGEMLFKDNGCQGCHKVRGRGGSLGPDLTTIGQASFHLKRPHHDNADEYIEKFHGNVNLAYIFESVYQPKIQPDSSQMINYGFTKQEALDLTVYMKSFQAYSIPEGMIASSGLKEEKGRALYRSYCSACHGKNGQGTNFTELGKMGPALGNPQFLSIADRGFLSKIISGSGSRIMPAWGRGGGLSGSEIDKISSYVLSLRKKPPVYAEVIETQGSEKYGRIIFNANCSGCHGLDGEYETDMIGPTLRSPQLLSLMNNQLLYDVITKGREGTAMPAWNFLSKQDLADLLEYMESWRAPKIGYSSFRRAVQNGSSRAGRHLYFEYCSSCHGDDAEGGIGPSLNSPEFLRFADSKFLHKTFTGGRRGTAMGSYSHLGAKSLGNIVAYLRSGYKGPITGTATMKINGSEFNGQRLFARICSQCHGESGQGYVGPSIASVDFLTTANDEFIWEMIAYGRTGSQMKGNLRGQSGTSDLSRKEIRDIVAYIRTFEYNPPSLEGISTIPGNNLKGREDFNRICAQCHGPGGGGGNGPAIGRPGFLENISDGFIIAMMMSGRDDSEMKRFGRGGFVDLDMNSAMGIVSYLRTKDESEIGPKYVVGTPQIGAEIFKGQCYQCHHSGSFAPDLFRDDFVKAASVGYLQATMSLGRHESAMRSMMRGGGGLTEFTGKEINDIIAYIKQGKE